MCITFISVMHIIATSHIVFRHKAYLLDVPCSSFLHLAVNSQSAASVEEMNALLAKVSNLERFVLSCAREQIEESVLSWGLPANVSMG